MTLTIEEAGDEVAKAFVCGFCGAAPAARSPEASHRACRNSDCACAKAGHVPNARVKQYQDNYVGTNIELRPVKRSYKPLTEKQKENRRKNLVKARKAAAKKRAKSRGS